jgi:hypothetical protein
MNERLERARAQRVEEYGQDLKRLASLLRVLLTYAPEDLPETSETERMGATRELRALLERGVFQETESQLRRETSLAHSQTPPENVDVSKPVNGALVVEYVPASHHTRELPVVVAGRRFVLREGLSYLPADLVEFGDLETLIAGGSVRIVSVP